MITETSRLILRKFKPQDTDTFHRYRNDALVGKYQSWKKKLSLQEARKFVSGMESVNLFTDEGWIQIAFELKTNGKHIGDCAIKQFDERRQAEIGISIDREYWNKGYGFEALSGLFSYAFSNLGLHRIIAITDTSNQSSIKLLTKLGMRNEGHTRESYNDQGYWTDEFQFAILTHEWKI